MIEKNEILWGKEGNYSTRRMFSLGSLLNQIVTYFNPKQPEEKIRICGYSDSTISIFVQGKKSSLLIPLYDALSHAGYPIDFNKVTSLSIKFELPSKNVYDFAPFLNIVEKFMPIQSIKKEIFDTLGIKAIPNEKEFYEDLNTLIHDNKVDEALARIQSIEDEHILWNFARLLEKNEKFVEALSVYQDIPKENPHYHEANEQAANIILQYENSDIRLGIEEKNNNLESKVRFMLRASNPDNQRLLDQRFEELCGGQSFSPTINKVNINEDTVIALAHQTASLKQANQALQQEKQELLAIIEKLKINISTNLHTFFNNSDHIKNDDSIVDILRYNANNS